MLRIRDPHDIRYRIHFLSYCTSPLAFQKIKQLESMDHKG
uniref:Uncharacterized protein n=1 Tax=Arundo donax TaxID=35708 RepID=A0A0A9AFE8_ARUDO